jgi:asparagine synthase (glutamine-hydrolysing)
MDVASMRASLELRTPYLSRRLVETVASFDQRAFLAFGQKSVLRRLAARYLPEQFVRLPKRGFVYPADVYLANETREPRWPSLPDSQIRKAWQRRRHGRGWTRIAVRLSTLSAFALQVPTTSTA